MWGVKLGQGTHFVNVKLELKVDQTNVDIFREMGTESWLCIYTLKWYSVNMGVFYDREYILGWTFWKVDKRN